MFTEDMCAAYKRLLVFGLLSVCLVVFISSNKIERVYAAPCTQDCEDSQFMCEDSCATACSTTDADCNGCILNCQSQFRSCASHAIYCEGGSNSYSPSCQVGYADHCPVIAGMADCSQAHNG